MLFTDWEELEQTCRACQKCALADTRHNVVFGTGPLGLFSVQIAKLMGAVNIVMVGLQEDTKTRFEIAK